jgi:non-specific serine/threonine protein kinase
MLQPRPSHDQLIQSDAVRLFVERAATVQPLFRLTEQNATVVAQVCQRLDGLPLALELAAARVKLLAVEQIAQKLDNRFHLLTTGSRTALPRHQTLRATIDWSYELLSEPERNLLRRLAVFIGGFTLEAAEAVCDHAVAESTSLDHTSAQAARRGLHAELDMLDLLTRLVDRSLVVVDRPESGIIRYRLLETIRSYGLERLAERGEMPAIQQQHAHYFLALAEEAEPELRGPQQLRWFARLESEHDNLRAALVWSQAEPARGELGVRLAGALWWFWDVHRYLREGRGWLEATLAQTTALGRTAVRAKALCGAGGIATDQGDFAAAQSLLEESVVIWRAVGDPQGLAHALIWLAEVVLDRGFPVAIPTVEESLVLCQAIGDQWGMAWSLYLLSSAALGQDDVVKSQLWGEQALDLFTAVGDQHGIALVMNRLGLVARNGGNYTAARSLSEEALTIFRQLGDPLLIGVTLAMLGLVAWHQGDYQRATVHLTDGLTLARQLHYKPLLAVCFAGLAAVVVVQGKPELAAQLCGVVEALCASMQGALWHWGRTVYQHTVETTRTLLGETAFAATQATGQALTVEQASALAATVQH